MSKMRQIEFSSQLWLRKIGTGVIVLFLINYTEAAPQYQTSTESQQLTTIQYYEKPVNNRHKQQEQERYDDYYDYEEVNRPRPPYPTLKSPSFTPAEFLMTVFRTAVDVVKNMNRRRMASRKADNSTDSHIRNNTVTAVKLHRLQNNTKIVRPNQNVTDVKTNATEKSSPRVMDIEHYSIEEHDPHYLIAEHPPEVVTTTTEKVVPTEMMKQARYADPWTGYYDFIINEGSFKFWSGFQLFTALLLLYSALSAIYYAKFNPITPDYDTTYDDYFFGRSLEDAAPVQSPSSASPAPGWISSLAGMGSQTYQRIMETLHSSKHKYS